MLTSPMRRVNELVSSDIANYLTNKKNWDIFYNAKDEGMKGDGVTDDYAAFNALITKIGTAQATIIFPPGTYKISTSITIPSNINLYLTKGAMLSPDSGDTITINGPVEAGLWQIFTGSGTIAGNIDVMELYPQWWGAKGDGVTDDTAAINNAIICASNVLATVVFPPTISAYKVTAGLTIDCSKISLLGFNTVLDFGSLTSGNAITVTSTASYTTRYRSMRKLMDGIIIRGGPQGSSIAANGIYIGTTTTAANSGINNFSIENFQIDGFQTPILFSHNAWRIHFINGQIRWGITSAPTGLQNFGENMTFINVIFADNSSEIQIGTGTFHFYGCSFDNCRLRVIGDSTVHVNDSHFENPGSSSTGYRYASVENAEGILFISDSDIIFNGPSGGGTFNQSLFYCDDTVTYKGLHLNNLKLFQNPNYVPQNTDPNKTLVAGNGRVTFNGGMATPHNFSDFVIASAMGKLYNAGAEVGTTAGWSITSGGTGTFTNDNTVFKNGTRSFKLSVAVGQTIEVYQDFEVRPGQLLLTQSWMKYNINGTGANMQTQLFYFNRLNAQIGTDGFSSRTSTSDWNIKTNAYVAPQGVSYVRILFRMNGGSAGSASDGWFDDVIVNTV